MAQKRTLSAKDVLKDIRDGESDADLMKKYRLSRDGLRSLLRKLVAARALKQSDVDAIIGARPPTRNRSLDARAIANDIKSGSTDDELMEKYRLSNKSLQILLKKLAAAGLTTQADLDARPSLSVGIIEISEEDAKQEPPPVEEATSPVKARRKINFSLNPRILKAADTGQTEETKRLLLAGADSNAKDKDGMTALMYAVASGHGEIARLLVGAGADLSSKNKHDNTALVLATLKGHGKLVKMMLEAGSDPNTVCEDGCTALYLASTLGFSRIAEYLVKAGAAVDACSQNGNTPLMIAAHRGHRGIVEVLLSHGASLDVRGKDGLTPLVAAVANGHLEIVQLLLEMGANVNDKDNDGGTALIEAAVWGYTDTARLLLDAGADYDAQVTGVSRFRDGAGMTALMAAAMKGHADTVKLLLDRGANPNLRGGLGQTALTWAKDEGHTDVVRVLEGRGAEEAAAWSLKRKVEKLDEEPAFSSSIVSPFWAVIILIFTFIVAVIWASSQ